MTKKQWAALANTYIYLLNCFDKMPMNNLKLLFDCVNRPLVTANCDILFQ